MVMQINSEFLLKTYRVLSQLPKGGFLFAKAVGKVVPYSGSIPFEVTTLVPGNCGITVLDKRAVRNHLRSVHAMALANAGEIASGLAVLTAISSKQRGILVHFDIEYTKKARGRLFVHGHVENLSDLGTQGQIFSNFEIFNEQRDQVAFGRATWHIS